jgi:uncharacterized protein (TIGR01244 family)
MKLPAYAKRVVPVVGLLAGVAGLTAAYHAAREHDEGRHHFHKVVPGVLYRSRQPRPEHLKELPRRGVKTVIDLRPAEEDLEVIQQEQQACAELGLTLVNIPVGNYAPDDDQVEQFLKLVRAGTGGVLVHCELGRSRTGIMVAAYRVIVDGWRPRQALAEMAQWAPKLTDAEGSSCLKLLERLGRQRQEWLARTAPAGPACTRPGADS